MKRIVTIFLMFVSVFCAFAQESEPNDWANTKRYEEANNKLTKSPVVVFIGNSITDSWYRMDQEFFDSNNFAGRGISGQVTAQMLVRFRSDVINLKPKAVFILAGINDIARNQGYISVEHTFQNLVSMVELAKAHKIKVVLCTLLAADRIPWRSEVKPIPMIAQLNAKIKNYAAENKIEVADMFAISVDENQAMKANYRKNNDAVHPGMDGYKAMEEEALRALKAIKVIK